jgi:putative tricarboxylic transport membrane protein
MLMSQGDLRVFFGNFLVGGITALGLVLLLWPLLSAFKLGWRRPRSA